MVAQIITQIGSLPYENVKSAIDYSLRHDIPFLPELPKKGDLMMDYIKTPGRLSCLGDFRLATKGLERVKLQSVGPTSIVSATKRVYNEYKAVEISYEHITKLLEGIECEEVFLFLDEPSLETAGFDFTQAGMTREEYEGLGVIAVEYKLLWSRLRQRLETSLDMKKIRLGIHTCGNADWEQLFNIDFLDLISFDASRYSTRLMNHNRKNKHVGWGIKTPEDILDFRCGDLITPPCGLGNFDCESVCESTLELLLRAKNKVLD